MEHKVMLNSAVLVGIAGNNTAYSLSLYNLKAYAMQFPVLRKDWEIIIIQKPLISLPYRNNVIESLYEEIVSCSPKIVGFSCYMWNIDVVKILSDMIVQGNNDIDICWGGPEIARDYIKDGYFNSGSANYLISGEGEAVYTELLKAYSENTPLNYVKGLAHRKNIKDDFVLNDKQDIFTSIESVPSPYLTGIVEDELLFRRNIEANIETQRGCNLRCSYCIYHKDMPKVVYSTPERVKNELRFILNKGVTKIRFVDANFTSDIIRKKDDSQAKDIIRYLIENKYRTKLFFELIPGFIDEEFAELLGEFNSIDDFNEITVGVGVQTINLDILKTVRRRIKREKFDITFDLLQKNNVFCKIDLIIGLPGEKLDSIATTQEYMINKLENGSSHLLCCHVMRGLPGTELMDIAKQYDMVFSSVNEPHELIMSPDLPREDMLIALRRTAVIFRLVNHTGWADREMITERKSSDLSVREAFFSAKNRSGISSIELIDHLVDGFHKRLENTASDFAKEDFPRAETWWWVRSPIEISSKWLVEYLNDVSSSTEASVAINAEIVLDNVQT